MPLFRKKPILRPLIVEAHQVKELVYVETISSGTMRALPGDWIVSNVWGDQSICKNEDFIREYEPVDDPN